MFDDSPAVIRVCFCATLFVRTQDGEYRTRPRLSCAVCCYIHTTGSFLVRHSRADPRTTTDVPVDGYAI